MSHLGKRRRDDEAKTSVKRRRFDPSKNKKQMHLLSSKGEVKCVDQTASNFTLVASTTGNKVLLNGTIPGSAIQNRLGRRIHMKSVQVQGQIVQYQNGTTPVDDFVHIFLVYDHQVNAAAFNLSDLLQSCDSAGNTGTSTFSFLNMSNSKRFKILRHEVMKLETIGVSQDQPSQESTDAHKHTTIQWFVPLNSLETQYNTGTAGTQADIQTGGLWLMTLGLSAAADSQYQFQGNARLRFLDA